MDSHAICCTIGLGSNSRDRESQISDAIKFVLGLLKDGKVSSVYETEACNGKDKPYLNAVIKGRSVLPEEELVEKFKNYERQHGRQLGSKEEGIIPIDLDLVIRGSRILRPKDFERHYFNKGYRELLAAGAYQDE